MAEVIINANPPPVADDDNDLASGTTNEQISLGKTYIYDSTNSKWIRAESTTSGKLKTQSSLVDTNELPLDVEEDAATPANTRGLIAAGRDTNGNTRFLSVNIDAEDGMRRAAIEGKVSISAPIAPDNSTPVTIDASSGGLNVLNVSDTDYTITDGTRFTITQIIAGSEGDPNEKGSVVEVFFVDEIGTEHIVDRVYVTGFTRDIYPDTSVARDGTIMDRLGLATQIRVRRRRLGGAALELDAVVRGYEI